MYNQIYHLFIDLFLAIHVIKQKKNLRKTESLHYNQTQAHDDMHEVLGLKDTRISH